MLNAGKVLILSTSKTGLRYHQTTGGFNNEKITIPNGPYHYGSNHASNLDLLMQMVEIPKNFDEPNDNVVNVSINQTATYQTIIGFGGAFTGAVSYNLKQLSSIELQSQVYQSYYSKATGNGFSMMRIPIGGCDFDVEPWAYNEYPKHDPELTGFTKLDRRDLERIEQINELRKVTGNEDIKFFGAAWSPPRWMKTNNDWTGFSALRDEFYDAWANYHLKYLELMYDQNIKFWGVSTGNEPLDGVIFMEAVRFMSLGWIPENQGKWLSKNLGPILRNSSKISHIKILAGDDQRYTLPWWIEQMQESYPEVTQYIDGFAVHWYADKMISPLFLDRTAEKFPEKFIIASEACTGSYPWDVRKPILGSWSRCEDYVLNIMEDLNHFANAWVDWNLILDKDGGPNYASNFVDAPVVANKDEIIKQPMFYGLGHFSRFILPGSVRIYSKSSHRFIKSTAFLRPDGYVAVVLYNS